MFDIVREWRKLKLHGRLYFKGNNRQWRRWDSDDYAFWNWGGGAGIMFKSKQSLIDFIKQERDRGNK